MVNVKRPITEKLSTNLELQNRLQNNWHNQSTFFIRPSVTYNITPSLSLTQGYAWDPAISDQLPRFHNEQRIWEQVQYNRLLPEHFTLTLRSRLEERFVSGADGTGLRLREMVKLMHSMPYCRSRKLYWVTYDELFTNGNTISPAIHSGIDQNRTFLGMGRNLSGSSSIEAGYLVDYNHKVHAQDKWIHALVFNLNFTVGKPMRSRKRLS